MGLISQTTDGRYVAEEKARIDVLRSFVLLRGRLISRMTVYGAFILGLLLFYAAAWPFKWNFRDLLVLIVCLFSASVFFFEAYLQHMGLKRGVQRV
jgi:O-antigen/teichoic acid export membrane protein